MIGRRGAARSSSYTDLLKEGGDQDLQADDGGWLGITDKYWAAALIPDQKTAYDAKFSGTKARQGALPGRLPDGTA